jgi:hypothetical protein
MSYATFGVVDYLKRYPALEVPPKVLSRSRSIVVVRDRDDFGAYTRRSDSGRSCRFGS